MEGIFCSRCRFWHSCCGINLLFIQSLHFLGPSKQHHCLLYQTLSYIEQSMDFLWMTSFVLPRPKIKLLNNIHLTTQGWVDVPARCHVASLRFWLSSQFCLSDNIYAYSILSQLLNGSAVKGRDKSLTKLKPHYNYHPPLTHTVSQFTVKNNQPDQALIFFGKSILTFSDCLLVFVKLNL